MPDEQDDLADAMLAASRALVGIAVRGIEAAGSDLTVAQHRVLLLLEQHGELSVNDIADLLGVNQSNASRHASRLAKLGLVTRKRAPHDARAVALRLNTAGREQIRAVREARLREIRSVLSRMELADAERVAAALRAFEAAAHVSVAHEVAEVVH
jgi:DNA-binding MarR family transcriptional regulator